ncbi:hypothetical protein A3O17_03700 [Ligilactobacillus aviarius]|uniref:NAD(P)H-binding protein n=1 Tax=Ligilactobacillus aviarius TaxID=1606 RepID=UPI0007D9128F|nr:NAD(P)H-binding protein [Ligilactobacillus aviarius]OAQ08024.1 hypothetical protein A3O15_00215 [Ligilactobacillus aviarius]OAS76804.1 hypothetical protein A3O17_03700 [Ligilactobacillus aviarius]
MAQNVLILGAAGQIARIVTQNLLSNTDANLVLYGRNLSSRITIADPNREKIIDGDFNDSQSLSDALQGIDIVYLNSMSSEKGTLNIIAALKKQHVNRIIGATIIGIYDEFGKKIGKWTKQNLSSTYIDEEIRSAKAVEQSGLEYTLLRLAWLYNDPQNHHFKLIPQGQTVNDVQVTRQAVADVIVKIIANNQDYINQSLAVVEPNTEFNKPSFY